MGENILIVDDDQVCREYLASFLGSCGYRVWQTKSGEEAIKSVRRVRPDAILLDLVMPTLDGLEVVRILRSMDELKGVPIIAISSKDDKRTVAKALNLGADDFVAKPIDEMELTARLRSQLRARKMFLELEEDRRNLAITLEITRSLSATLNTNEILDTIVKRVAEITSAERSSIILIDKVKDMGYIMASHDNPDIKGLAIDLKRYPEIKRVLETKEALVIDDLSDHPLMKEVKELIKDLHGVSVLVVPIFWEEEVLGTLFLRVRRRARSFTKQEINFCQVVANASFYALRNAYLYKMVEEEKRRLEILAITDQLTDTFNHSYFYVRLDEEFGRAERYGLNLSCLMMDIDNFKSINDTYGHLTGDKVLKEMALAVKKAIRKTDVFARYGGEEFVILMPHTDLQGAVREAERIRQVIEDLSFDDLPPGKGVTVSIGVASYPDKTVRNSHDLITNADKALYAAKNKGKNTVVVFHSKGLTSIS